MHVWVFAHVTKRVQFFHERPVRLEKGLNVTELELTGRFESLLIRTNLILMLALLEDQVEK